MANRKQLYLSTCNFHWTIICVPTTVTQKMNETNTTFSSWSYLPWLELNEPPKLKDGSNSTDWKGGKFLHNQRTATLPNPVCYVPSLLCSFYTNTQWNPFKTVILARTMLITNKHTCPIDICWSYMGYTYVWHVSGHLCANMGLYRMNFVVVFSEDVFLLEV